jgi:hypothetical protein
VQYCATGAVTALQIVVAVALQKLRREIWWCCCFAVCSGKRKIYAELSLKADGDG